MFQWALIDANTCATRDVVWNSVKASFTEIQDSTYEVLLEVSSNNNSVIWNSSCKMIYGTD